jgi:hypothetical protein
MFATTLKVFFSPLTAPKAPEPLACVISRSFPGTIEQIFPG